MKIMVMLILVLSGIAIIVYFIAKVARGHIPTASESELRQFKSAIPKEFHNYLYCLGNTGIAFDLDNDRVLLMEEGMGRIYPREKIRAAQSSTEDAKEWLYSGGDLVHQAVGKINTALDNRIERRKAFDQSGIFIQVADIDHPV